MIAALLLAGILGSVEPNVSRVLAAEPQSGFDSTAPEPCGPVVVQAAATIACYTGAVAGDLYTTALALKSNPRVYEQNPLGFNGSARTALKVAVVGGAAFADFTLRRKGHTRSANFLRAIVVLTHVGLIVNNLDIAYGGHRIKETTR